MHRAMDLGTVAAVLVAIALVWAAVHRAPVGAAAAGAPAARGRSPSCPTCCGCCGRSSATGTMPLDVRLVLVVLVAWIVSPIDLIPEFIPVLGPFDDVVVAIVALRYVRRRLGIAGTARRWPGSPRGSAPRPGHRELSAEVRSTRAGLAADHAHPDRRRPRRPARVDASSWTDGHETVYDASRCAGCAPAPTVAARPACPAGSTPTHADGRADAPRRPVAGRQLRDRSPVGRRPPHRLLHVHPAPRAMPVRRSARRADRHAARSQAAGRHWHGGASMIIATAPFIAGYRVTETKGQVFGLVVRSRGLGGNLDGRPPVDRRRRDPRVHEPARGHPPPGDRPDGPERDAGRRQRGHLDALRLVRARRHDVRDRRLRHRRGHRPERTPRRAPAGTGVPRSSRAVDARAAGWSAGSASSWSSRASSSRPAGPGGDVVSVLFLFVPGVILIAAVIFERHRYRSLTRRADRRRARPGRRRAGAARAPVPADGRAVRRPDDRGPDASVRSTRRPANGGTSRSAEPALRARIGGPPERFAISGVVFSAARPGRAAASPRARVPDPVRIAARTMTTVRPAPGPRAAGRPRRRRSARDERHPILNRELSWLEFNARVLHEARRRRATPSSSG